MSRSSFLAPLALFALLAALTGCSSKSAPSAAGGAGTGMVTVRLTDAPGNFDHVFIDIIEVSVHSADTTMVASAFGNGLGNGNGNGHGNGGGGTGNGEGDAGGGAWITIPITPGVHDLLDLRNGVFETIGSGTVPAGTYDQVRLKLGPDNSVVIGGVSSALKVPSGMSSGFKLFGSFVVPAGGGVDVGIDFDAQRSLHETGNGRWMLRPVARMFTLQEAGGIAGTVVPDTVVTEALAIQVPDTVATTTTDPKGHFVLSMLPAGTYSVHLAPANPGFAPQAIDGVVVTAGHITDLGTITLAPVATPTATSRPVPVGPGAFARAGR